MVKKIKKFADGGDVPDNIKTLAKQGTPTVAPKTFGEISGMPAGVDAAWRQAMDNLRNNNPVRDAFGKPIVIGMGWGGSGKNTNDSQAMMDLIGAAIKKGPVLDENGNTLKLPGLGMKKGGVVKAKSKCMKKGGSVSSASKRADGIAVKGKTRGKIR
jgi:hypothetical protein